MHVLLYFCMPYQPYYSVPGTWLLGCVCCNEISVADENAGTALQNAHTQAVRFRDLSVVPDISGLK